MDARQGQLFDTGSYTVEQRPETHSEVHAAPSPQHEKMMRNRERVAGTPATQDSFHREDRVYTAHMGADYGIPVRGAAPHLTHLTPFDTSTWRAHGEYAEMPLHGNDALPTFGTSQRYVNPGRVEEIRRNPGVADDPRFPEPERPLVADVGFRRNGQVQHAPVLFNGNHRVAAASTEQLFTPVSYIRANKLADAKQHAQAKRARFGDSREAKNEIAAKRLFRGDPTAR